MATLSGGVKKKKLTGAHKAARTRLKILQSFANVNVDYTGLLCTATYKQLADVNQVVLPKQSHALYDRHHTNLVANIAKYRRRKKPLAPKKQKQVLSEIHGERMAAMAMHEKALAAGFQMYKGYEGGGAGIDQIWANFDPAVAPVPANGVMIVVDAKGGSADINSKPVYVGKTGIAGNLAGGCYQLDANWVYVDADQLSKTGATAQSKAAGTLIKNTLTAGAGPPRIVGVAISDGALMTKADYNGKHWLKPLAVGKSGVPELAGISGNFTVLKYV